MSSHRLTVFAAIATVLAGTSLYPLFMGTTWFWAGAGATITVAGVGTLTRLRRLPVIVCLAAMVLGLTAYLNLVFEAGHSLWHVLPTLRSLDLLGRLARTGVTEAGKYAPPAPELSGVVLLGSGGIGIVALLTDLVAVRLRSVALAGVPLLLLITEPFTVSASRSGVETVIAFCLGTFGYLAMLSAESKQRIRDWEPPHPGYGGPDTSALSAAGRRVGIASVLVALCLPLFVPGLHVTRLIGGQPGIGRGSGAAAGGGPGFPSPEKVVSQQLQESKPEPVLSYSAAAGGQTVPQYLQLYVLDQLTATGWQVASNQRAVNLASNQELMPPAPGLVNRTLPADSAINAATTFQLAPNVSTATQVSAGIAAVLPVPYPASEVGVRGNWQASTTDLTVYSTVPAGAGLSYNVVSLELQPPAAALAAAGPPPQSIAKAYLSLPGSYTASGNLADLAREVTSEQTTAYGKAEAIQSWLSDSGTFSYSLKAPSITNATQLLSFLTDTKKGYCQQFAVAMADLARLVNIPSRVVIGYTSGTRQPNGSWLVTTSDAHEWPELYFKGFGWLRFEPTPAGTDGQGSATLPAYATEPASTTPGRGGTSTLPILPTQSGVGKVDTNPPAGVRQAFGGGAEGKTTTASGKHAKGTSPWEIVGLLVAGLLVLALIAPCAARLAIRRRRWGRATRGGDAELAHAAWRELQDDLINYRAGYSSSETPRALGTRLGARVSAAEARAGQAAGAGVAALERITLAEEHARYAAQPVPGERLRQDSAEFRRALAATMPVRARWQARVLPLSVIVPTASGVGQAADAVGNIRLPRPQRGRLAAPHG